MTLQDVFMIPEKNYPVCQLINESVNFYFLIDKIFNIQYDNVFCID